MKKRILIISCIGLCLSLKAQDQTINGTLDVTGKVGIGVSSPTEKLQINTGLCEFKTYAYGSEITVNGSGGWSRSFRIRKEGQDQNIAFGGHNGTAFISTGFDISVDATGYQSQKLTIRPDGNIGIGTTGPLYKLEVNGTFGVNGHYTSLRSSSNTFLRSDDNGYTGYGSASSLSSGANILLYGKNSSKADNLIFRNSTGEKVTIISNGNMGIGTSNPDEKLAVNGKIHTKEVKVDLNGWSDFVFKPSYDLPTLEEVEKHISANGHLKDIPSEKEVIENGIHLGEMNSKLLQKIEELTLYTIEQEKQLDKQEKDIKELKELVTRLMEEK